MCWLKTTPQLKCFVHVEDKTMEHRYTEKEGNHHCRNLWCKFYFLSSALLCQTLNLLLFFSVVEVCTVQLHNVGKELADTQH